MFATPVKRARTEHAYSLGLARVRLHWWMHMATSRPNQLIDASLISEGLACDARNF